MRRVRTALIAACAAIIALPVSAFASGRSEAAPRFSVTVSGSNHSPRAGKLWRYVVRAVDPAGQPVGGTAIVQVLVRGRVVDTVGWFGFEGVLRRSYRFSTLLVGKSAVFRAKVIGPGGVRFAGFKVHVRPAPI
jgi:hypothetical protein